MRNPLRTIGAPITNERDLFRFVMTVSIACISIALVVDVVNQLVFFVDWARCLRSWTITTTVVLVLAVPISRTIGRAHLELYREKMISRELSRTDHLTGLPNRRALIEAVSAAKGDALILVIADIDRFKRVNDTYGHDVGDRVLKGFGAQLQETVRSGDLICRLGGEEFVVVMPGADAAEAARIAERARRTTESREFLVDGAAGSVSITVSIGLAEWRENWNHAELYRRADRALYLSKSAGRNRVTQDAA